MFLIPTTVTTYIYVTNAFNMVYAPITINTGMISANPLANNRHRIKSGQASTHNTVAAIFAIPHVMLNANFKTLTINQQNIIITNTSNIFYSPRFLFLFPFVFILTCIPNFLIYSGCLSCFSFIFNANILSRTVKAFTSCQN